MNTSYRNIDKDIQKLLKAEPAFKGTVLEGRERRYTVINERDVRKYVPPGAIDRLQEFYGYAAKWIEEGREKDGKNPYNSYIVINTDEPYIDEIIAVMKRHGHWDEN